MINFVRHTCLKDIAISTTCLPDPFEDSFNPLYAREVSEDEYTQLNSQTIMEKDVKSHVLQRNKHLSAF